MNRRHCHEDEEFEITVPNGTLIQPYSGHTAERAIVNPVVCTGNWELVECWIYRVESGEGQEIMGLLPDAVQEDIVQRCRDLWRWQRLRDKESG